MASAAKNWVEVSGVVQAGYGVASGQGADSPYPAGSIAMQTPFFQARGFDLSPYFAGTVNVSIAPRQFKLVKPQHTFRQVAWFEGIPPEDFSFSACQIAIADGAEAASAKVVGDRYDGWIYYPHPETKPDHFQDPSIVEVIAMQMPEMRYGNAVKLWLRANEVQIT